MTSSNDRRAQQAQPQPQPQPQPQIQTQTQSHTQPQSQPKATSPSYTNGTSNGSALAHDFQPPTSRAPMPFANGSAIHTRDESWSGPLRSANGLSMGLKNDVAELSSELYSGNSQAPIGTPSAIKRPPTPRWKVVITGLPAAMTEDAFSSMLVWVAQDILSFTLDRGTMSDNLITASVFLSSEKSARLIHSNLNGHQNTAKTSIMNVNIMPPPGAFSNNASTTSREVSPMSSGAATASSASTYGGTPNSRSLAQSRFNIDSAINGLSRSAQESKGPETENEGFYRGRTLRDGGHNAHNSHSANGSANFPANFGPQSPIDSSPWDTRVSGKSFIENNSNDDETSALISDPLAYAENGPNAPRSRPQTQLPIDAMNGLSLNTNVPPHTLPSASSSIMSPHGHPMSPTGNGYTPYPNGTSNYRSEPAMWNNAPFPRQGLPPSNPADQNAPCNTLYVGNLPLQTNEEELKAVFSKQRGYKRLCFRTKPQGPMCFVEFEDVSFATKALKELYGYPLHNSTKGGIRLSFSKNPLGVRGTHHGNQGNMGGMSVMHATANGGANGLASVSGPPPGLSAPPGLGNVNQHAAGMNGTHAFHHQSGYSPGINSPWNSNGRGNFSAGGPITPGGLNGSHTPNGFGFNGATRGGFGNPPVSGHMNGSTTPNGYHHAQGSVGGMPPHMMGR